MEEFMKIIQEEFLEKFMKRCYSYPRRNSWWSSRRKILERFQKTPEKIQYTFLIKFLGELLGEILKEMMELFLEKNPGVISKKNLKEIYEEFLKKSQKNF